MPASAAHILKTKVGFSFKEGRGPEHTLEIATHKRMASARHVVNRQGFKPGMMVDAYHPGTLGS